MRLKNPEDRKYSKKHEWVKLEQGIATVGVTDYAQHALTDIVFVELPEKGKQVEQSKGMCVVESVKSVSDVYAPVSGEIVEANKGLESHPELVNQDPFEKGWIAKIKVKDEKELESLMTTEQYTEFLKGLKH